MSKKEKKQILFDVYSNNFKTIIDAAKNKQHLPKDFGCYCPICETHFDISKLKNLSLEHNPPKSLGGKDNILTCLKCNNTAGSKIDNEILLALNELEFMKFKPNSFLKTKLHNESTGEKGVNANFKIDEKGTFVFDISPANNPKIKDSFLNSFVHEYVAYDTLKKNFGSLGFSKKINFQIKKPNRRNERLASIALLKMAYLLLFEKLGHAAIFGKHMRHIRNQIQNPNDNIITKPFWLHYNYPDNMLGINIITKPIELKCFLVVFDIKTKSDIYRSGICIPGLDENDDLIYENIEKIMYSKGEGDIDFETNNFLNSQFDIRESEKALLPLIYWGKLFEHTTAHNSG